MKIGASIESNMPNVDAAASAPAFRYWLYGLAIASDMAFPELPEISDRGRRPDVVLRLKDTGGPSLNLSCAQPFASFRLPDGSAWLECARAKDGYELRLTGAASFIVTRDGRRVTRRKSRRDLAADELRHVVIDLLMPRVLGLLGYHALHATAVVTRHGVLAFTGPSGCGKSTMAASFALAGYPCLGDDCLRLSPGSRVEVTPAYPGVRLWPDAFAALTENRGGGVIGGSVAESVSKIRLFDDAPFSPEKQPLCRVYRLVPPGEDASSGDTPELIRLTPREALIELLSQSFRLVVDDREMLARELECFRAIIQTVPAYRLKVPRSFSALPAVRQMLLEDLERSCESGT